MLFQQFISLQQMHQLQTINLIQNDLNIKCFNQSIEKVLIYNIIDLQYEYLNLFKSLKKQQQFLIRHPPSPHIFYDFLLQQHNKYIYHLILYQQFLFSKLLHYLNDLITFRYLIQYQKCFLVYHYLYQIDHMCYNAINRIILHLLAITIIKYYQKRILKVFLLLFYQVLILFYFKISISYQLVYFYILNYLNTI